MSKLARKLGLLAAVALLVVGFQNCSKGGLATSSSVTPQAGTQLAPPDSPPGIQKFQVSTYQPILADRYYLDSLFTDIFGPTAHAANAAMLTDAINQGSPCSLYDNYNAYNATTKAFASVDSMASCTSNSLNLLASSSNPSASVTRQALLVKACNTMTNSGPMLTHALAKISTSAVPDGSTANVLTAVRLFYRTQPDPSPGVIQSLQMILPVAPAHADWQKVLYTICVSSYWQVI